MEGDVLSRVRAADVLRSPIDHSRPRVIPGHRDLFIVRNTTIPNASNNPPALGKSDLNAERKTHGVQPIRKALCAAAFRHEVEIFPIVDRAGRVVNVPLGVEDQELPRFPGFDSGEDLTGNRGEPRQAIWSTNFDDGKIGTLNQRAATF